MALVVINNNPELSEAFSRPEVQDFLLELLKDFDNPYAMKSFLRDGVKKTFNKQVQQLKRSYRGVERLPDEKQFPQSKYFKTVIRCYDGVTFTIGDLVIDMEDPKGRRLPIGMMYEDDRGLHVRLNVDEKGNTITWRDLGRVEHQLPEIEDEADDD